MMRRLGLILIGISVLFAAHIESGLDTSIGLRSAGLSGALYHAADCEHALVNPAYLTDLSSIQVKSVMSKKWDTLDETYVGAVIPLDQISIGLTWFYSGVQDQIIGTLYNSQSGTVTKTGTNHSYYNQLIMLSAAKSLNDRWSVGANVKWAQKNLSVIQAQNIGVDAGTYYRFNESVKLSLMIQNLIQTGYQWSDVTETVPMTVMIGAGISVGKDLNISLGLGMDNSTLLWRAGVEGNVDRTLYYRAGINESELSLGCGFKLHEIDFDYSYTLIHDSAEALGAVHRFGIGYTFDPPVQKQRQAVNSGADEPINDVEAQFLYNPEEDAATVIQVSEPLPAPVLTEQQDIDVQEEVTVRLNNGYLILSGTFPTTKTIELNDRELFIRPDRKVFWKETYSDTNAAMRITLEDGTILHFYLQISNNRLIIKGGSSSDSVTLKINDKPVAVRPDGKFYIKLIGTQQAVINLD